MAIYGYARVSTTDQDPTIQIEALKAAGCDVVRSEQVSGTKRAGRDELETPMAFLRSGDTLMVTRIDRLARSVKDLQDIVHELKAKDVALKAIDPWPLPDSTQLLQPRLESIKATLDRRYLIATSRRRHWSMNRWTRHQHAPSTQNRGNRSQAW